MTERLLGAVDCGGTWTRTAVYDMDMNLVGADRVSTDLNYEKNLGNIATSLMTISSGQGELITASMAVAAKVEEGGILGQAGGLVDWRGRSIRADLAAALNWEEDEERTGADGDMMMAALSQHSLNMENGWPVNGYATTLSSGWGGAGYRYDGTIIVDEPGHEKLRHGGICPCGEADHAEAYITGNGALKNEKLPMEDSLKRPEAAKQFVIDLSDAVVAMVERQATDNNFYPRELRWTGSVALGQPELRKQAAERAAVLAHRRGLAMPVWKLLDKGEEAGLHGAFLDAKRLALAA